MSRVRCVGGLPLGDRGETERNWKVFRSGMSGRVEWLVDVIHAGEMPWSHLGHLVRCSDINHQRGGDPGEAANRALNGLGLVKRTAADRLIRLIGT